LTKGQKIGLIIGGSIALLSISYFVYRAIRRKRNTMIVEGSFKGRNCDELHAFQSTSGRVIGGMNDKVNEKLKELYDKGINPEVKEVFVEMDADKMEVKWKVKIGQSKDGKAWMGFTSRGSAGRTAYERANGKHVGQDFDSVLKKVRKSINEPNAEMKLVLDYLYNLNPNKESLGKCPTRQLFYKYTKPNKYPKH
jgi:hypothetical protein